MPVVYVDYPGETSLKQIYGTFNRAMLRMIPNLRAYADPLTNAMVEFYLLSQVAFGLDSRGGIFGSHKFSRDKFLLRLMKLEGKKKGRECSS